MMKVWDCTGFHDVSTGAGCKNQPSSALRVLSMMMRGKHSRSLCGPADGFGAHRPLSLLSIQ
eukprot:3634058-Amphidinium_carterae.1